MSIAYRMLGSRAEAEDVVQDAWLKWHAAAEAELRTPLAWLTTVTTRLAIDRIRRLQSEQTARTNECLTQPWLDELAPSAEDEALRASSVSEAVELLFDRLSDDERAAFVLHEAFDCDYAQIAEVVGKTPAHCRQLAHRARRRLAGEQEGVPNGQQCDAAAREASRSGTSERLREIIHRADAAGAMRMFADRELTAAGAARGAAARRAGVAASLAEDPMTCISCATLEAYALPPDWGAAVALVHECDVVGIVRFAFMRLRSGYIVGTVTLATRGAEVEALNRRFGSRAIARLLTRIAGREAATTPCVA